MLTDRESEMTPRELFWIETLCKVRRRGQILRAAGYIEEPTVEDLIYEIPGITAQTAEALAAAVFAVRANILRERGRP
jgi:hypothetical protein